MKGTPSVLLRYVMLYLVSLQRTFCSLRSIKYSRSYTRAIAIVIMANGGWVSNILPVLQVALCTPGNTPSRGPWALLVEFLLTNANFPNFRYSLKPFMLCTQQGSSNYQVLKSSGMIRSYMGFEPETSEHQAELPITNPTVCSVLYKTNKNV